MSGRAVIIGLLLGVLTLAFNLNAAESYRRIEVPEDHIEEFVAGFRPLPRKTFEALVASESAVERSPFDVAKYTATFDGEQFIDGTATLELADSLSSLAVDANRIHLLGGRLAIKSAQWLRKGTQLPALLGRFQGQAAVFAVPSVDQLKLEWTYRNNSDVDQYKFEFPHAFVSELMLRVPLGQNVYASGAIVSSEEIDEEYVTWKIRWSGRRSLVLHIPPITDTPTLSAAIDAVYQLRPSGGQLRSRITLSNHQYVTAVELQLSPNVRVSDIRIAGQNLVFSNDSERPDSVFFEIPASAATEKTIVVDVFATAAIEIGQPQSLPRIRPSGIWQNETVICKIDAMLSLDDLQLDQCTCVNLATNDSEEELTFDLHSQDGDIRLLLENMQPQFTGETFLMHRMLTDAILTDCRLLIHPTRGEVFDIFVNLNMADGWFLIEDSVKQRLADDDEGQPSDVEYALIENRLRVRLTSPATSSTPTILSFNLRNDAINSLNAFDVDRLIPFVVPDATRIREWIYVSDTPVVQLRTTGVQFGNWQRIDSSQSLPQWIRSILDVRADSSRQQDIFIKRDVQSELVTIYREPQQSLPTIESSTEVTFSDTSIVYHVDLDIDPQGKSLDQIEVFFSRATYSDDWSRSDRTETPSTDRLKQADGEFHRIRFAPTDEPFQLQFQAESDIEGSNSNAPWQVPLLSVRQANGGQGKVTIIADGPIDLDIDAGIGLDAVPLPSDLAALTQPNQLRGVFRFDDSSAASPRLEVKRIRSSASPAGWIWRNDLRSYYSEQGKPRHRADYFVQAEGARQLRLQVPPDVTIDTIELNGEPLESMPRVTEANDRKAFVSIPLPAQQRFPTVTVKYAEPNRSLATIDRVQPPILSSDLPSLQRTWQIWLPRDYRLYDPSQEDTQSGAWIERIAGFFGAPNTATLETSFIRAMWRGWGPDLSDPMGLMQRIETSLGSDSIEFSRDTDLLPLPWGIRLKGVAKAIRRSRVGFEFFVDREELRRIGVFASQPLSLPIAPNQRAAARQRLRELGLVLVVDANRVILTSRAAAALHASPTDWLDDVSVDGSNLLFGDARLTSVEDWATRGFDSLWQPSQDDLEVGLHQAGWQPDRRDLHSNVAALKVYHRDTIVALASGILCFGFALGWRLAANRWKVGLLICMCAFACSLLLPQPGSVLSCAFAWSLLTSGFLRGTTKKRPQSLNRLVVRSLAPTRAATLFILAGLFFANEPMTRGQIPEQSKATDRLGEAVYFPTDKDRNPNSMVYLSPKFYESLRQNQLSRQAAKIFISKADYTAVWPEEEDKVRLVVNFEVTTFQRDSKLELPIFTATGTASESFHVDGNPMPLKRDTNSSYLQFGRAGDYQISFDIILPLIKNLDMVMIDLSIPVVSTATLELNVSEDVEAFRIPTALGQTRRSSNGKKLLASLGPTDRLTAIAKSTQPSLRELPTAEQTILLQLEQDQIRGYVKFSFPDGAPTRLAIQPDGKVELAKTNAWDVDPITKERVWLNNAQTPLEFRMDSANDDLLLPNFTVVNAKLSKVRIAVIHSPQKRVRLDVDNLPILSVEAYDGPLPEGTNAPDLFFETNGELPTLKIMNVPLVENWTNEVSYFLGRAGTNVRMKVRVTPEYDVATTIAHRRIRIPKSIHIDAVTAFMPGELEENVRWARHGDEIVVFFLNQPSISSSAPLDIRIEGTLSSNSEDSVALPTVEVIPESLSSATSQNTVNVYHAADVNVTMIREAMSLVTLNSVEAMERKVDGYRLHGVWNSEFPVGQTPPEALTIRRQILNRRISGTLTTRLVYDETWLAEITTVVQCEKGIDVIYFDVPSSLCFQQPVAYEGDVELRVDSIRGGPMLDRRLIAVWLPDTQSTTHIVQLTANLTQDRTSLPKVNLVNVDIQSQKDSPQQFIELPTRSLKSDRDTVFDWNHTGLLPQPIVDGSNPSYQRFLVSQPDYSAQLKEQQSGVSPEVSLLSTVYRMHDLGEFVALSEFDVKPARRNRLLISVPAGMQVVQVFCDENRTLFFPTDPNGVASVTEYECALDASPWPQRLQIIYRGKVRQSQRRQVTLQAPQLSYRDGLQRKFTLPIEEEFWSVYGPGSYGTISAGSKQEKLVEKKTLAAARIRTFARLWNRAQASVSERPRKEKSEFLQLWNRYLATPLRADYGIESNTIRQPLDPLLEEYPNAFDLGAEQKSISLVDLWGESQWIDGNMSRFQSAPPTGEAFPALTVQFPNGPTGPWPRFGAATLFLFAGIFLTKWSASGVVMRSVLSHPHLVVTALGFAWWSFLAPAWLGAFASLVAIGLWIWNSVRGRYHFLTTRRWNR